MTEITRVPLQPIAKGALSKLWLSVAAVALAAGGLAWATLPPSVDVTTVAAGTGPKPTMDDIAVVKLKGHLKDGKVFQEEATGPLDLRQVVPGFAKAIVQMQKGGKYKVVIPSALGYGPEGRGEIPGNADLYFDIQLVDFMNAQQFEQQQMLQQLQAQQAGKGAPQGAMPEAPAETQGAPKPE